MSEAGWGWWTVFELLEDYETGTLRKICPAPGDGPLIPVGVELSPTELEDHLQKFGSYLASLTYQRGWLKAKSHALKEGLKTGVAVKLTEASPKTTMKASEGAIFANDMTFAKARQYQIEMESLVELVQGWIDAYEWAYNDISRLITHRLGEVSLQTGRHP